MLLQACHGCLAQPHFKKLSIEKHYADFVFRIEGNTYIYIYNYIYIHLSQLLSLSIANHGLPNFVNASHQCPHSWARTLEAQDTACTSPLWMSKLWVCQRCSTSVSPGIWRPRKMEIVIIQVEVRDSRDIWQIYILIYTNMIYIAYI